MIESRIIKELTQVLIDVFRELNTRNFDPGEIKGLLLYVLLRTSKFEKLSISIKKVAEMLKNNAFRDAWLMLSYQIYWVSEHRNMELIAAIRDADIDPAIDEVRRILSFDSSKLDIKMKQQIVAERLNNDPNTLFFCLPDVLKQKVLDKAFYVGQPIENI